jgi:hypothetical protein
MILQEVQEWLALEHLEYQKKYEEAKKLQPLQVRGM